MFCFQCQETAKGTGCTVNGVCGKKGETAVLQDLLIYTVKGIAWLLENTGRPDREAERFMIKALFTTITNVNFNSDRIIEIIRQGLLIRDHLIRETGTAAGKHDWLVWNAAEKEDFIHKAESTGVLSSTDPDMRSLRELLVYGIKGIAAYADHAVVLGYEDAEVHKFMVHGLASTLKELSRDEMIALVMGAGETAVKVMSLLDRANTETYGHPEISTVNLGVRRNPGILISGHDLKDLEELLLQTQGSGIDIYTHGEMLPANYYPAFKKFDHLAGNYGNSWWHQNREFASFNGPLIMTTNCLIPPADSYKDRLFTTGNVSFPGIKHIAEGKPKDFSQVIALARTLPPPGELETGSITGGFAHNQVFALADKITEALKSGAVKKFVVMAGCDGRQKGREYYSAFAEALPGDTVILTAGCAKYRYNKLPLGDISGIPRVLDAGQCNDSYSLALIALKLKEIMGADDINDLPIVYNIAWYEQKAVTVLLALLHLGVKNIHLGPTLPGFLSPGVADMLVKTFGISGIDSPAGDVKKLLG